MLIFQDDAVSESTFSRYASLMRKCINAAWDDWNNSEFAAQMQTKSFRAQFINNQIIYRARQYTEGQTDVRVDKIRGNHGLVIEDRVFVRPKFARTGYRSSNYPTRAALAFHDQSQDFFGGIARLELVYTLNRLGTAIQDICLTQRHMEQIQWMYPLVEPHAHGQENLVSLPTGERTDTAADRIIKLKKSHGNDQGNQYKRGGDAV